MSMTAGVQSQEKIKRLVKWAILTEYVVKPVKKIKNWFSRPIIA